MTTPAPTAPLHCSLTGHRWVWYGDLSQQCSVCKLMIGPEAYLALTKASKKKLDPYSNALAKAAGAAAYEATNALAPTIILLPAEEIEGGPTEADCTLIARLAFFALGAASVLAGIWLATVIVP